MSTAGIYTIKLLKTLTTPTTYKASATFTLYVVNDPPEIIGNVSTIVLNVGTYFFLELDMADFFEEPDGETMRYNVLTHEFTNLPSWLNFF